MLNKDKKLNEETLFYRFNNEDKMMYVSPHCWELEDHPFGGRGDSLWRTGMAYICYGDDDLLSGITNCFRKFKMIDKKDKYWYQLSRASNRYREDDVSRDQAIMALSALEFNGKTDLLHEFCTHLPFRLSRKFHMTITMWFWVKWLANRNPIYKSLFLIFLIIEHTLSIPLTKLLRKIAGMDVHYDPSEPNEYKNPWDKSKISYKVYNFAKYPEYGLHLAAWMFYTVKPKGILGYINKKMFLWAAEKDNYLIRGLSGCDINSVDIISKYSPTNDFRWSSRLNGDSWIEYIPYDKYKYNCIEVDILTAIAKRAL